MKRQIVAVLLLLLLLLPMYAGIRRVKDISRRARHDEGNTDDDSGSA